MGYEKENFGKVAQVGFTIPGLYSYSSDTDTLSTIGTDGYFDNCQYQLRAGDFIFVNGSDAGALCRVVSVNPVVLEDLTS
jgi:hypothetical protein